MIPSLDLGGLGATEGPVFAYTYVPQGLTTFFLPWLMILGLLCLKPNRHAAAWLVVAAIIGGASVKLPLELLSDIVPSEAMDDFRQALVAFVFGLATLWLLGGYLAGRHRFFGLVSQALILGAASILSLFFGAGLGVDDGNALQSGILLLLCAVITAIALTVGGVISRKSYRPLRFSMSILAAILALWSLLVVGILGLVLISNDYANGPGWKFFALTAGALSGFTFLAIAPFLLLSFASQFYRERLKAWMRIGSQEVPPEIRLAPIATEAPI